MSQGSLGRLKPTVGAMARTANLLRHVRQHGPLPFAVGCQLTVIFSNSSRLQFSRCLPNEVARSLRTMRVGSPMPYLKSWTVNRQTSHSAYASREPRCWLRSKPVIAFYGTRLWQCHPAYRGSRWLTAFTVRCCAIGKVRGGVSGSWMHVPTAIAVPFAKWHGGRFERGMRCPLRVRSARSRSAGR